MFFKEENVYFIRKVMEYRKKTTVEILNEYVTLDKKYCGQYVLIELNLKQEKLKIFQEIQTTKVNIHESGFKLDL
jgi:hypothetical protein